MGSEQWKCILLLFSQNNKFLHATRIFCTNNKAARIPRVWEALRKEITNTTSNSTQTHNRALGPPWRFEGLRKYEAASDEVRLDAALPDVTYYRYSPHSKIVKRNARLTFAIFRFFFSENSCFSRYRVCRSRVFYWNVYFSRVMCCCCR